MSRVFNWKHRKFNVVMSRFMFCMVTGSGRIFTSFCEKIKSLLTLIILMDYPIHINTIDPRHEISNNLTF